MSVVVALALALVVTLLASRAQPETARRIYRGLIAAWFTLLVILPVGFTLVIAFWLTGGTFMDFGVDVPKSTLMFDFERDLYASSPLLFLLGWYLLVVALPIAIWFVGLLKLRRSNQA